MPFALHPRVPAALATTVLVAGCVIGAPPNAVTPTGGGKKAPVTYEGKVKKVDALTKTFSLENNEGLKRASTSIQRLVQALSSLSSMNSPQAMPASAVRYQLHRIASDLTDAGAEATYELAGIERNGAVTLVYDDATGEVTGVVGQDAEIALKFVNNGRRRSYEATILKSPDGTTGTFFIEVEGGWVSFPSPPAAYMPPPMIPCDTPPPTYAYPSAAPYPYGSYGPYPGPNDTPAPYPYGSYAPAPYGSYAPYPEPADTPAAWGSYPPAPPTPWPRASAYALQQTGGWFGGPPAPTTPAAYPPGYDPGYGQGYDPGYGQAYDPGSDPGYTYDCPQPEWTPPPPPSPPPYKFMGGEYPNLVTSIKVKLDVVPQGDKALAFQMEGTFDEPEAVPFFGSNVQVPTHWVYKARVPKVRFDWESHMHLDQGKSTFKGGGALNVEGGPEGDDTFQYALSFDEAKRHGAFSLTHVDAKVKLLIEGDPSRGNSGVRSVVVSTEDDSEIGTVEPDTGRPGWVIVKLKKDDKRIDWQLIPSNMFPQPGLAPPAEVPPYAGPPPVMPRPKPARTPVAAPLPPGMAGADAAG